MSVSWFARGVLVGFAVVLSAMIFLFARAAGPGSSQFTPTKSASASDRWSFWIGFAVGFVGFGAVLYYAAVHDTSAA